MNMYTIIWKDNGEDKWNRLEKREEVLDLLKQLKENPNVSYDDIWVFLPEADNYAHAPAWI